MKEAEVIKLVEKKTNNIKFIRIIFPDVLGREMSFTIPCEEMRSAFYNGKGFDGSSIEGFARTEESDLIIVPEAKTFRVLPWEYELDGVCWKEAIVFGDIYTPEGRHFDKDSRYILKKVLKETQSFGKLFVGPELEFFIFASEKEPKILDFGGYFYGGKYGEVRKLAQIYLKEMGIETDYDHHEVAFSQHEIDLKFNDALNIADSLVISKYIIKRICRRMGLFASFMPKPLNGHNGSGLHLHLSLWENKKNLFFKKDGDFISDYAKNYIMGLISYGKEIQLVLNQWVNSYKRLVPGYEAPVYLAWGRRNRSSYVRVPEYRPKKENFRRIELRSPDPALNIYLGLALIHAAGIEGIKKKIKFQMPEERENIYKMKKEILKKKGIELLSQNLKEALKCFRKSQLVKRVLGISLFNKIIENKEKEWQDYRKNVARTYDSVVSSYEIERYFPVL